LFLRDDERQNCLESICNDLGDDLVDEIA
jgi:hypothetical protein